MTKQVARALTDFPDYLTLVGMISAKADTSYVDSELAGKADVDHTHAWDDITGKPTAFTPVTHEHDWAQITGKPTTFTPAAHTHLASDLPAQIGALDVPSAAYGRGLLAVTGMTGLRTSTGTVFAVKTAPQSVNNTIVLVPDNHLLFNIGANETWFAELYLIYSSVTSTPRLRFDFTGPASPTLVCYHGETYASFSGSTARAGAFSTLRQFTAGLISSDVVVIRLVVVNGSNAGTVQFRWAQNAATNENTTLQQGSFLRAERLA